jgi:predicted hotdog family 3-hydroxylacyl-ACP dehydratase
VDAAVTIPFTQFLRPDGRRRAVEFAGSAEIEAMAQAFIARGGWFECEELNTGQASLTACALVDDEPQDVAGQIVMNGPEVPAAVERLVREADTLLR